MDAPQRAREVLRAKWGVLSRPGEDVLVGQSGWSKGSIIEQVERLCGSPAFDDADQSRTALRYLVQEALSGRVPLPADIAPVLGDLSFGPRSTSVRNAIKTLRQRMAKYYEEHAQEDEIRLIIPPEMYIVFAPLAESPIRYNAHPIAEITEPLEMAEVYRSVLVRGFIEELDPDLRVWLVVLASDGYFYPQCQVSRRTPFWMAGVHIGQMEWGDTDGVVFTILLVSADIDGDFRFLRSINAKERGFGPRLPADIKVLARRQVIRRDIRPNEPLTDRLPPKR